MANRLTLLREILQDFFGRRWYASLLVLLALLCWPLIVFWRYLAFDPVKFSEEWLKLGTGGLAVLLIIEIARRQQEKIEERRRRERRLAQLYRRPVESLLSLLDSITSHSSEGTLIRGDLRSHWDQLAPLLRAEIAEQLLDGLDVSALLAALDPERCSNLVADVGIAVTSNPLEIAELRELHGRLTSFKLAVSDPSLVTP